MKLNLLPTSVSREKTARRAIVIAVLLSLFSIILAVGMIVSSKKDLDQAKADALDVKPKAEAVAALADTADKVITQAEPFLRNVGLVKAIDNHVNVYPKFYAALLPYMPSFFRVITMQATPVDAGTVNVNLVGVIKNQVMYNDLKFALLRIPGVNSIQPSPIGSDELVIPALTPQDLTGRIHKQSEPTVPDDPLARLDLMLSRGGVTTYDNRGFFGSGTSQPRQAMPNYNVVTVAFTMPGQLQTPDVRATLAAAGAAPAPTTTTATAASNPTPATAGKPAPAAKKPVAKPAGAVKPPAATTKPPAVPTKTAGGKAK